MKKAYPYYDFSYKENVAAVVAWLAAHAPNVHLVGRNGMHKYNNQDHSMFTAMLTVENIHGADHDIWAVNVEEEYHEERRTELAESPDDVGGGTGRDAARSCRGRRLRHRLADAVSAAIGLPRAQKRPTGFRPSGVA